MRSKTADAAARRLRPVFLIATALLVVLLGFFAYALLHSQSQQRSDIEKRFKDRARIAATVNESLFSLVNTTAIPNDIKTFGGKTVDQAVLTQRATVNQQLWSAIVGPDGTILAKTGSVPPDVGAHSTVKEALSTKGAAYSSIMKGPGGTSTIESAIA